MALRAGPALGNLVRLYPLSLDDLPAHPALASLPHYSPATSDVAPAGSDSSPREEPRTDGFSNGRRPALIPFVQAFIREAAVFVDDTLPATFTKTAIKGSPPAATQVQQLKRMISPLELADIPWTTSPISRTGSALDAAKVGEAWFARKSLHANRSAAGTAGFFEFDHGLRVDHSEHEREYTPDVFDSYKVLDWDAQMKGVDFGDDCREVVMCIYEMAHKMPAPLNPRVFPVLVVTALTGRNEFIVVQVPVDLRELPEAFYSNGRNTREGDTALKRKTPVLGTYTSIERCRMRTEAEVEWIMATASDAKGSLPTSIQKLGVPGAVLKDVGFFIKWTSEKRSSG